MVPNGVHSIEVPLCTCTVVHVHVHVVICIHMLGGILQWRVHWVTLRWRRGRALIGLRDRCPPTQLLMAPPTGDHNHHKMVYNYNDNIIIELSVINTPVHVDWECQFPPFHACTCTHILVSLKANYNIILVYIITVVCMYMYTVKPL